MAKWQTAKMIGLVKPCICGSTEIFLWNDTGTNWFCLECSNDECEVDGPSIDIDQKESMYDLKTKWENS